MIEQLSVQPLIGEAILYKALSVAFAYPEGDTLASLNDATFAENLRDALARLPHANGLGESLARFTQALTHAQLDFGFAEEYTYLFMWGKSVPPYESSYTNRTPAGNQELADVSGFYRAFGFDIANDAQEMPDHISAELEFLAMLCAKEAYALEHAWQEQAEVCRAARREFLAEHLNRWLPAFAERIHAKARAPFYPSLAEFTCELSQTSESALAV